MLSFLRASAKVHPSPPEEKIRAPVHYHLYWPATRTRLFARILTGDPKRRKTYDENIRLLNDAYANVTGNKVHPHLFIQKVNPVLFALAVGISNQEVCTIIRPQHRMRLWQQCAYSSCAHCRQLAYKHSGCYFGPVDTSATTHTD